jgi:hypothetical protein
MTTAAAVALAAGLLATVLFLRSGRLVPGAAAAAALAVATWADPWGLAAALAVCALAGLVGAAPRWAGEAAGAVTGAHRGFAVAMVLGLPAAVTAAGVQFAAWQSSR